MKKLFLKLFLWFWVPVLAAAFILAGVIMHGKLGRVYLFRLGLHDTMLFTLMGLVFCYVISRYLTRPLAKLGAAAEGIAEGRLDTRMDPALRDRHDEIADLARNFDRMADRIEALVTGQRRLLGDVSHELRSPLARLIVALGLVKHGAAPDEAAENLERIGIEAQRLDALIGQLLTLTRIDSGVDRGAPVRFDFANLVQEVASDGDFEARARNRSVVVTGPGLCMIAGFEELLRSAVENVVRNAVRHTQEGTAVEISLEIANASAHLRVRDHGPGVADSMLAEIFLPFRRAGGGDSGGAGLGLAIAERAVSVHRGTIRARNAPEGGLIVEIDLPIA